MEESVIQEFYKGTRVFLTGGTGFMGKALIEKLLRDTEVETIYVLVREKKGKTAERRIDELFDDVVFDRLKSHKPKYRNRVEPIAGDCSIAGLGLSITDRQKLISTINIVLHVAATVNFNEHIKLAYSINVNATKDILDLAKEMTNLKSIVHVSTAYSNCNRNKIEEKIYDIPVNFSDVETVLDKMSKQESELCTQKLLGEWPNTYTFTKALAESVIKARGNGLPIGIFRPSIIISTYKEPMPGWIDNLYGPTGMAVGTLSGIIRVGICDGKKIADLIPIDTCVAAIVAVGWEVAQRIDRKVETIPVFNYVSSPENPLRWEEFLNINYENCLSCTPERMLWYPNLTITTNRYKYQFLKLFSHTLPALVMDLGCLIIGGKPRLLKIYGKVHKFTEILEFFSTREWIFTNKNVQGTWRKLNKRDQELFPFSMSTVHWLSYFRTYPIGVRRYMLKEPDSTLEQCNQRLKRYEFMHRALKAFLIVLVANFGSSFVFSLLRNLLKLFK